MGLGEGVLESMNKVWKDRGLHGRLKATVPTTMVFSVAFPNAEIIAYSDKQRRLIESFHEKAIVKALTKRRKPGEVEDEKKSRRTRCLELQKMWKIPSLWGGGPEGEQARLGGASGEAAGG